MGELSAGARRAFVRRHTRLGPVEGVPDLPDLRLHLGTDAMGLMHRTGLALGIGDPPLPFWAFAWPGGLALVRYLLEHPDEVEGRRVLDVAAGSGVCGIVAARLGAASVDAVDIDPFAEAAIALNARANDVRIAIVNSDPTLQPPEGHAVILAGDICYEEGMATRLLDWLEEAAASGTRVLLGDPGRAYLPAGLEPLATYEIVASREIEGQPRRRASVYAIGTGTGARSPSDRRRRT